MNLLDDQVKAKSHLSKWKVGALFMEAGTGKTRVAIELVNTVTDIDAIFWIGPLRTIGENKDSVISEINKWGGFKCSNIHYFGIESIQSSNRIYSDLVEKIEAAANPFLIVDESIKIKNWQAKRTKRMLYLSKKVKYKLILNGTPVSRNLLDLWAQMEFLDSRILNMTLPQFKNDFCKYTKIIKIERNIRKEIEFITGYENIDYLYSLIDNYIYRCDLSLNLGSDYHKSEYKLSESELEEYRSLKEYFLSFDTLEEKSNNIFLEMSQKMQHSYCCAADKFTQVDKIFESVRQEDTIIFCKFVVSREECAKRYPKARVLSYSTSSLGLNLQDYNSIIYFDKTFDYFQREQSERRIFRTGQQKNCNFYDLTGDVGLEHIIDQNIKNKIDMVNYFKGKTKEELNKAL